MSRIPRPVALGLIAVLVAACSREAVEIAPDNAPSPLNVIDEVNLTGMMLDVAEPAEAVAHFRAALQAEPGRIDLRRGLARSLVRAGRASEAVPHWRTVNEHGSAGHEDRVALADALLRNGDWEAAAVELERVPATVRSFERVRAEALVADAREDWDRADSYYEAAVELASQPAGVLNNWGFSLLSRGDAPGAERLFVKALAEEPGLFTAKNNLVMARGAQRNYSLPLIPMTQTERAQLLHTMAITAIRQDDVVTARTLLQEAVDTHPQHFDVAARALRALDADGSG